MATPVYAIIIWFAVSKLSSPFFWFFYFFFFCCFFFFVFVCYSFNAIKTGKSENNPDIMKVTQACFIIENLSDGICQTKFPNLNTFHFVTRHDFIILTIRRLACTHKILSMHYSILTLQKRKKKPYVKAVYNFYLTVCLQF